MTTTVDKKTFRVNLSILLAVLIFGVSAGGWARDAKGAIDNVAAETKSMREALGRVEKQLQAEGKALAVLETLVGTLDRRVGDLERSAK